MIQCPKCGFSQPKDQYCARCGVNMVAYQPPEQPFLQRFLKSNLFYISLVAVIILTVASFLLRKDKSATMARDLGYKNQFQFSSEKSRSRNSTDESLSGSTQDVAGNSPSRLDESLNPATDSSAKGFAADSASTTAGSAAISAEITNAKSTETTLPANRGTAMKLVVHYYEMNARYISLMTEESRRTGQYNFYDGYEVGALNGFQKKLEGLKEAVPLLYSTSQDFSQSTPKEWFLGLQSSNTENNIGFYHYVEGEWINPNTARINFQVTKSWREGATGSPAPGTGSPTTIVQKASYPLTVEIPRGGAFFMAGLLVPGGPNGKNSYQNEDYIASVPPFGILKSNKFRRGETQLVLIVELAK